MGTAYSLGEVDPEESESLSTKLAGDPKWRPLVALALIIFIMFYSPCFVAVVRIATEAGSWKWGAFSMALNTIWHFYLLSLFFR
jgi:ferrous iron transport protein B